MKGIFISYRRQDTPGHAGRLYDRLQQKFGADRVFMDVAGDIEPGLPFDQVIKEAVGSCEVLLVMIGEEWVTAADEKNQRRLDDENDYLRLEAATALARGIRVIPVLVSRARMPGADELPDDLKALAKRQAIELSDERWNFDVDRLIKVLEGVIELEPQGSSPREGAAKPPSSLPRFAGYGAIALLIGMAALGLWRFGGGSRADRVVVPNLVGLPMESVRTLIADANLTLGETRLEETDAAEADTVMNQAPEAGARVDAGTPLKLIIAAGPPSAAVQNGATTASARGSSSSENPATRGPASERLVVPSLAGKTLEEARAEASDRGLSLKVEFRVTAGTPLDQVIRQSPPANTPIEAGGVIQVVAAERQGLQRGERERGYRYVAMGDTFVFERGTPSLVLRENTAVSGAQRRTGLYLAPAVDAQVAALDGTEPSKARCSEALRTRNVQDLRVVPVRQSDAFYCVRTGAGTVAAVYTRTVVDPPDRDGDRALIRYWIWE